MKLSEFKKGGTFWMGGVEWLCTDVGSRVVVAIKMDKDDVSWYIGPTYAVVEHVIDEFDQEACTIF